jgi:hypothetical protein
MAIFESLLAFQSIAYMPHLIVYEWYLMIKYTLLFVELRAGANSTKDLAGYIFVFWGMVLTCICCCFCCCNCCFQKDWVSSSLKGFYQIIQKLNRFLIKILLGPKEGILERFAIYQEDKVDGKDNPRIFLRNKELTYREVSVLAILIASFGLLAAITAWDSFFLDTSYVCSVKPGVHCFPIALDFDADEEFNITDAQEQRITNCSYWTSENVSSRVTFSCFQWALDTKAVVSDVGGLLAMFVLTMKIAVSGSLAFLKWAGKKYTPKMEDGNIDYTTTIKRYQYRRIFFIVLVGLIEILTGCTLVVLTYQKNNDFFYEHGNQFLLVIGIFSSLLLLPLEKYALHTELTAANNELSEQPSGNHNEQCDIELGSR